MIISHASLDFLPGQIVIEPGKPADYAPLQRFHYLAGPPATWAGVATARYLHPRAHAAPARLIGVAVLSWPTACQRGRHRTFDLGAMPYGPRLRWTNAHLRTISRVIVHPQFRAIGLAPRLVDHLCRVCPTPLVEASARMGRAHPMFERAGFQRVEPAGDDEPIYYWRRLRAE